MEILRARAGEGVAAQDKEPGFVSHHLGVAALARDAERFVCSGEIPSTRSGASLSRAAPGAPVMLDARYERVREDGIVQKRAVLSRSLPAGWFDRGAARVESPELPESAVRSRFIASQPATTNEMAVGVRLTMTKLRVFVCQSANADADRLGVLILPPHHGSQLGRHG